MPSTRAVSDISVSVELDPASMLLLPELEVDPTKISFWAPIPKVVSVRKEDKENLNKSHTIIETTFTIIPWWLVISFQVISVYLDVVSASLIPVDHLLRACGAIGWCAFTPDWRFGWCDWGSAFGVQNLTLEWLMVHVGLAASIEGMVK